MPIPSDFITSPSATGCMLAGPVHRPGPVLVDPPAGPSDPVADVVLHDVRQLIVELRGRNVAEATEVVTVQVTPSPLGSSDTTDHHLPGLGGFAPVVATTAL